MDEHSKQALRTMTNSTRRVLCINTGGVGNLHGVRMRRLAAGLEAEVTYHDLDRRASPWAATRALWHVVRRQGPWHLIYQEGTSILAGACLIRARKQRGQRFIVSSGDPIGGFFAVTKGPLFGKLFGAYERRLYRACTAFVGWTPYLTGAALQLGAHRAITIEGAVDLNVFRPRIQTERTATRTRLGLPPDALVCGVVGSLAWTPRQAYCYGLELIETLKLLRRSDVFVLVVGDGEGRARLEAVLPEALRTRVVFTGRLPEAEVAGAMNAMDIGFVTQTLDTLGNYRLTTKLPEYLACGTPVAMSAVPGFYDYVASAGWALPPFHPASQNFHRRCADWIDRLPADEVAAKARHARAVAESRFDYEVLGAKFRAFVQSLLEEERSVI